MVRGGLAPLCRAVTSVTVATIKTCQNHAMRENTECGEARSGSNARAVDIFQAGLLSYRANAALSQQ